jgi:thiol-disulfide isomerase/thioredoxin
MVRLRPTSIFAATLAALAAMAVTVFVIVAITNNPDDRQVDVVLDVPGEYQTPGIATNAPVQGQLLAPAEIFDLADGVINTAQEFIDPNDPRPLLINFWFSNCQPCKREMPALQEAHRQYGDRVRFIGINPQDSPEITRTFAEELGIDYELFRDPNANFVVANGVATFPTTFFVDADGRIRQQKSGELSPADIRSAIEALLNGS